MNNWDKMELFDDSEDLAEEMRAMAEFLPRRCAYYLREAAENLEGMWELLVALKKEHCPVKPKAPKKTAKGKA